MDAEDIHVLTEIIRAPGPCAKSQSHCNGGSLMESRDFYLRVLLEILKFDGACRAYRNNKCSEACALYTVCTASYSSGSDFFKHRQEMAKQTGYCFRGRKCGNIS